MPCIHWRSWLGGLVLFAFPMALATTYILVTAEIQTSHQLAHSLNDGFLLQVLRSRPKDQNLCIPSPQTANDFSWSLLSSSAVSGYMAMVLTGSILAHSSFILHPISKSPGS